MAKTPNIPQGIANLAIQDLVARRSDEAAGALLIFNREIPAPIHRPCESLAYHGGANSFELAIKLLNQPNGLAKSVLSAMTALDAGCTAHYEEHSLVDDYGRDARSFSSHPEWKALCAAGNCEEDQYQGVRTALGVNFGLAWVGQKKMADGHMRRLAAGFEGSELDLETLQYILTLGNDELAQHIKDLPWFKQFQIFLVDFRLIFDEQPNQKLIKKTFDEKVRGEMGCRAAFASPRHRAGILDDQCLTKRQFANVTKYAFPSPFKSLAARRVATWLIEYAGLNTQTIKDIPIVWGTQHVLVDDWAVKYDLDTGLLLRDFASLAKDSADPNSVDAEPSSFVFPLPSPQEIHNDIKSLFSDFAKSVGPVRIGDLIPDLDTLQPQWTIYPSIDQFAPSWAKLSYTVGPTLIDQGMDSLLAGALVGNLGIPIKSKLFYARITAAEIWLAARRAYRITGHSEPVPMPAGQLAFGARVVPPTQSLRASDIALLSGLNTYRQSLRRATNDRRLKALLDLHSHYILTLGYRIMIRFFLRAAEEFPLRASIIKTKQLTVDLLEKSSAGRKGGAAAVITPDMRDELDLYLKHCEALYARLLKLNFKGVAMQWLSDVIEWKDVTLLAAITERGGIQPLKTKQVVDAASHNSKLARDFGRKWMENALRQHGYASNHDDSEFAPLSMGCRTEDVDQGMRHEAAGRETTTAVSDSCERTWAKRMAPVMDRATRSIFTQPLFGLRKK